MLSSAYPRPPRHRSWRRLSSFALGACLASTAAAQGFLSDGKGIVAWGSSSNGQLNGIPTTGIFTDLASGRYHSLALRADGSIASWGSNGLGQQNGLPTMGVFTDLASGSDHSVALLADGSLVAWGNNSLGQLNGTPTTGVFTAIAAGGRHSLAVRANGSLVSWSAYSFLVNGTPATGVFTAVAAGDVHSLALRADGSLVSWGIDGQPQVTGTPATGVFTAIAAGGDHSLALRADGSIVAWGDDGTGIASGTPTTGGFIDVAANLSHALALRADGSIVAWGHDGGSGRITQRPTTGVYSAIAAGRDHSLALIARTDYDGDLRVTGTGARATLNRTVNVAGNTTIETTMSLVNSPVMNVAGDLRFGGGASISGTGVIRADALSGGGSATLGNGARLSAGLESSSRFTGSLSVNGGGALGFTGTGLLTPGALATGAGGEVRIDPGQRVLVTGGFVNAGSTYLRGNPNVLGGAAEIEVLGTASTAASTGLITGRDATMRFGGGLVNAGSLAFTGGENDVYGDVASTGAITVTGSATTTFYDDVTNNGALTVRALGSSTATAIFLGSYSGSGSIAGGGNVLIEGDLRPGNSPASVLVDANLALGSGASTLIEIAGTTSGLFDQVNVTGDLSLDGTLQVALLNDFELSYGDTFDIFTVGGTRTGFFDGLGQGDFVGQYNGMDLRISYLANGVQLQAVPEPTTLAALGLGAVALLRRRRK